ncbi:hypothetical protein J6Z39_01320 [bacterium]|nr:hypothetical protein [bacterium]MBP5434439.1 hypothetical protein [bacterium]
MKKILFVTLPLRGGMEKRHYPVDGNALLEIKEPIYFAATAALANSLKADDEVKVLLLETKGGENAGSDNAKLFEEELDHFNNVGAKINYKTLSNAFDPSKTNFQFMFKALIKELEQGAEIYADVTFGPKPLAFLLFTVFQFAEKFFDCSIGNIVYSKVEFRKGEIIDGSEMIYDITPLYLMNSLTNMIETSSSDRAIKTIEALFED